MKVFKILSSIMLAVAILLFYLVLAWINGKLAFLLFCLIAFAFSFLVLEVSHDLAKEELANEKLMTNKEIEDEIETIQEMDIGEYTPNKAERLNTLRKELFYCRKLQDV